MREYGWDGDGSTDIGRFQAKFLKEASTILSIDAASSPTALQAGNGQQDSMSQRERLEQSSRLLSQQPFVNLMLTCVQGEDSDSLVSSLLRFVQAVVQKTKENTCYPFSFSFLQAEREGLLLRVELVAGLFDTVSATNNWTEAWALALFQLLQLEVITPDRERRWVG